MSNEWRVNGDDLPVIDTASRTNWEQIFNIIYPRGSQFFSDWTKTSMIYECLGARTNRDNAFSRMDQAQRAVLKAHDDRVDTETEIGQQQDYDRISTFRGWSDMHDYFNNKYLVWSKNYKEIYGNDWDVDLQEMNERRASKSKNSNVISDEEKQKFLDKIKSVPVSQLR